MAFQSVHGVGRTRLIGIIRLQGTVLMFVVLPTYAKPLEAVDALVPAHRDYLQQMYQAGTFLLSGRREPRDGGVILADASSLQELRAALARDPFHVHGVATYQVIGFAPTMAAPALQSLVAA